MTFACKKDYSVTISKKLIFGLVLAIAGAISFWIVYNPMIPVSQLLVEYSQDEILDISHEIINEYGYQPGPYAEFVQFSASEKMAAFVEKTYFRSPQLSFWRQALPIYT